MCFSNKSDKEDAATVPAKPVKSYDEKLAAERTMPSVSDADYQRHEHATPLPERMHDHFVAKSAPGSGGFVLDPKARIGGMSSWGAT